MHMFYTHTHLLHDRDQYRYITKEAIVKDEKVSPYIHLKTCKVVWELIVFLRFGKII